MIKKISSRGPLRSIPVSTIVRSDQVPAVISQNNHLNDLQQQLVELQPIQSTSQAINIEPIDQNGENLELHPIQNECDMTDLQSNDSIASVESNAAPSSNENKVPTDIPSTKMKSVSRIINKMPKHEDTKIFEQQTLENNQNNLQSTNTGEFVKSNNPATTLENPNVLDPSLLLQSIPVNENVKSFEVPSRHRKSNMIDLQSNNSDLSVESIDENKVLLGLPSSSPKSYFINVLPMNENIEILEEETTSNNQMNMSEFLNEPLELNSSVNTKENQVPINLCPVFQFNNNRYNENMVSITGCFILCTFCILILSFFLICNDVHINVIFFYLFNFCSCVAAPTFYFIMNPKHFIFALKIFTWGS